MAELFANDAASTLNGAINNSVTSLVVTSAALFPTTGNFRIKIDTELMLVTNVSGTTFTVTRGVEGTSAASHSNGVAITHVVTSGSLDKFRADNVLTTSLASIPSSRKEGIINLLTDSIYEARDTGSVWEYWGPVSKLVPPINGDFSWVNQLSATVTTTYGGVFLNCPGTTSGQNMVIRKKTAPSTPYTIEVMILPSLFAKTDLGYGILFRESGTSKLVSLFFQTYNTAPSLQMFIGKHNNDTSYNSNGTTAVNLGEFPRWLRMGNDGTNISFDFSPDGRNWWNFYTVAKNDFFTTGPDEVGFFAYPSNNSTPNYPVTFNLIHWKEA